MKNIRFNRMFSYCPFYIEGLGITRITINSCNELVEIKGWIWDTGDDFLRPWGMICEMELLTDLMLGAGEEGEKIIESLSQMSLTSDQEQVFNIAEIVGKNIFFQDTIFQCSYTNESDKNIFGIETPVKCLLIENYFEKAEFTAEFPDRYISKLFQGFITMDLLDELLVPGVTSSDSYLEFVWHLEKIGKMYETYLECLEDGQEEIRARTRAGFNDGQLFRIARLFFESRSEDIS